MPRQPQQLEMLPRRRRWPTAPLPADGPLANGTLLVSRHGAVCRVINPRKLCCKRSESCWCYNIVHRVPLGKGGADVEVAGTEVFCHEVLISDGMQLLNIKTGNKA